MRPVSTRKEILHMAATFELQITAMILSVALGGSGACQGAGGRSRAPWQIPHDPRSEARHMLTDMEVKRTGAILTDTLGGSSACRGSGGRTRLARYLARR
jgi:hypothetical protein